eukprot:CAMPEP_0197653070 /NCGR_PEP_ID=MMETSP1338-20131121/34831_1 /TAXON_ID=43686 ORGANISM="Pelagodinium beii, Strain RCC1491" /NCGR_SAMPLE_ID=MMETSP1338 /ASSEMBLY_ACC=CAM_ASM_000754 /LENGTH=303 /DNA_ID=CAMNT_0043228071 /DNA_START=56 /DNA_END=967 /DNA_ORIENTATION=-
MAPPSLAEPELACRLFEEKLAELTSKLADPRRQQELQLAKKQAGSAKTVRGQALIQYPAAQRARKQAESKLESTRRELRRVLEANEGKSKANQGLQRTLQRLQADLMEVKAEVLRRKEAAACAEEKEEHVRREDEELQQTVDSMSQAQLELESHQADEQQKTLELKAVFRAKMQRVDEELAEIQQQFSAEEAELNVWKEKLSQQEEKTKKALTELAKCKAEADEAGAQASQALMAKQVMQAEFSQVQRGSRQLLQSLKEAQQKVDQLIREDAEVQSRWRLDHLSHVDSRVQARRLRDQEILVA